MNLRLVLTGAFAELLGAAATSMLALQVVRGAPPPLWPGRSFYLTKVSVQGNAATSACAGGYHMASQFEMVDPSNLKYDLHTDSEASIQRELEAIRRAFSLAAEQGKLSFVPVVQTLNIGNTNAREGFLAGADFEALLAQVGEERGRGKAKKLEADADLQDFIG
jgi:hypothetical protein